MRQRQPARIDLPHPAIDELASIDGDPCGDVYAITFDSHDSFNEPNHSVLPVHLADIAPPFRQPESFAIGNDVNQYQVAPTPLTLRQAVQTDGVRRRSIPPQARCPGQGD
jgi:hypothetical protein